MITFKAALVVADQLSAVLPCFHASQPSSMSSTHPTKPHTPIRRVTDLFRSPLQITKYPRPRPRPPPRLRSHSLQPETSSDTRNILSTPPPPPAVALQTLSPSTDSIVITSLPRVPFCCHEDLLTMPRLELVRVAQNINGRLPNALQISCGDDVHDVDIRRAIEVLVGIRSSDSARASVPPVPGAPRAVRTKSMSAASVIEAPWDIDVDIDSSSATTDDQMIVIPSSPLAMRRPRLEILKEEYEHEEPLKKRRRASSKSMRICTPPPPPPPRVPTATTTTSGSRLLENLDISASPFLSPEREDTGEKNASTEEQIVQRRRSARLRLRLSSHDPVPNPNPREVVVRIPFASTPKARPAAPAPAHVLRSHSQQQRVLLFSASEGAKLKRAQSDANVTLTRPKYHFRRGGSGSGVGVGGERGFTSLSVGHGFLPEVVGGEKLEEGLVAPGAVFPVGSKLGGVVDFLTPRDRERSASASSTISQEKSEIGLGVVEAMGGMVV